MNDEIKRRICPLRRRRYLSSTHCQDWNYLYLTRFTNQILGGPEGRESPYQSMLSFFKASSVEKLRSTLRMHGKFAIITRGFGNIYSSSCRGCFCPTPVRYKKDLPLFLFIYIHSHWAKQLNYLTPHQPLHSSICPSLPNSTPAPFPLRELH